MKLLLLGTNVLVPTEEGGQTACYMLPEQGIVLDASMPSGFGLSDAYAAHIGG